MTTTAAPKLNDRPLVQTFVNDNGRIACAKHAGYAFRAALKRAPLAPTLATESDYWVRTPAHMLDLVTCETCLEDTATVPAIARNRNLR
jgi:hypothetical protein